MEQDQPLQRIIKIGKASIGLINLDTALAAALKDDSMSDDQAAAYLLEQVQKYNYVPDTAHELYKASLKQEYCRLKTGQASQSEQLTVRILGPGCVSCNQIKVMLIDIMQQQGIAADIEQIQDLDEIWRYGVLATAA
jgi:hypothetical protein